MADRIDHVDLPEDVNMTILMDVAIAKRAPINLQPTNNATLGSPVDSSTQPEVQPQSPQGTAGPQFSLEMFDLGESLGENLVGESFLARHLASGRSYALKVMKKREISEARVEAKIQRKLELLGTLRHPGLLPFHGSFEDETRLFLLYEYAPGGNLYDKMQSVGAFPEPQAASYVAQAAEVLRYLHAEDVMHRDLKPERAFLDAEGRLRLAGFRNSTHAPGKRRNSLCGTLDYLAPEMMRQRDDGSRSYSNAVDMWTLGVFAYELLVHEPPFAANSSQAIQRRIRDVDFKPLPPTVSPEAANFVHSLLVLDPEQRLAADEVLAHPWIAKHCSPKKAPSQE